MDHCQADTFGSTVPANTMQSLQPPAQHGAALLLAWTQTTCYMQFLK